MTCRPRIVPVRLAHEIGEQELQQVHALRSELRLCGGAEEADHLALARNGVQGVELQDTA